MPWQVALVDMGHFISENSVLTGPQCPDEGIHPAVPPPKTVEEVPEGALVPPAVKVGPKSVLVIYCEAGQVRQNIQNMNIAKIAVIVADILISFVLGKRHHCLGSELAHEGWMD